MNNVMHVNTIGGKSVLTAFDAEGKPVSALTGEFMAHAITKQVYENLDWPLDAVYKVESRSHTWPCGWDGETGTKYFTDKESFDKYVEDYKDWAKCEDNRVELAIWEWDLGPNFISREIHG